MRKIRAGVPVAGNQVSGARLVRAMERAELADQALINYIALAAYSGDAWIARYRNRPRLRRLRSARVFIPEQRRETRGVPAGTPPAVRITPQGWHG
jgi:hypothetical protein